MINQLNLTPYPLENTQTVYGIEGNTTLELAGVVAKKVNECVEIVNGVDALATQARQVVDEMQSTENEFITATNDAHAKVVNDNQVFLDGLNTQATQFKQNIDSELTAYQTQADTALTNTKSAMDLALNNYKTTANTALTDFTTSIDATKKQVTDDANAVITNAGTQIQQNVNDKLNSMATDGTIQNLINQDIFSEINNEIDTNQIAVTDTEPTKATMWYDTKANLTLGFDSDTISYVEI